jgi:hypoxanthine phosphoribosyltransferase
MDSKTLNITEQQFNTYLLDLTDKIKNSNMQFDVVVGIENGGLHVSVPLAEALGIPHESIKVSWYDGQVLQTQPIVDLHDFNLSKYKACLFVDDIIDSRATINKINRLLHLRENDAFASVFIKFYNLSECGYYTSDNVFIFGYRLFVSQNIDGDTWVVFPWEK